MAHGTTHGTNKSNKKRYGNRTSNLRRKINKETHGRTANLNEDLDGTDWSRMETRARAAMNRNSRELTGRETTGQTGRVEARNTGTTTPEAPRVRKATYVWTEADQWAIVDGIRRGLSAREIRYELFPNMAPGSVTQEVQLIRAHMRQVGADMGAGADPVQGPGKPKRTLADGKQALQDRMNKAARA